MLFFKKMIYPNGVKTLNESLKNYCTVAKVVSVYDGDTITCIFSLNGDNEYAWKCRLYEIDAPEMNSKEHKLDAINAKAYVEKMVLNKKVYLQCKGTEKYGRILALVYVSLNDDENYTLCLNTDLVEKGYAKKYIC